MFDYVDRITIPAG